MVSRISAGEICVRVEGTVWNTLKGGGTEKKGGDTKNLKRGGGQAGARGRCLKKGGLEPTYKLRIIKSKHNSWTAVATNTKPEILSPPTPSPGIQISVWRKNSNVRYKVCLYLIVMTHIFLICQKHIINDAILTLLCLHYHLFYSFIILLMILRVFFSGDVRCHSYKEFFWLLFLCRNFLQLCNTRQY